MGIIDSFWDAFAELKETLVSSAKGLVGKKSQEVSTLITPQPQSLHQSEIDPYRHFKWVVSNNFHQHVRNSWLPVKPDLSRKLLQTCFSLDRRDFIDHTERAKWTKANVEFGPFSDWQTKILRGSRLTKFDVNIMNQTSPQPSVALFMLYLLDIQEWMKVLEIWWGSAYVATLLAELVWEAWHVTSLEFFKQIHTKWVQALEKKYWPEYSHRVNFVHWDGAEWYTESAPYDAILLSCAYDNSFDFNIICDQLKEWGKALFPRVWNVELYIKRNWKLELVHTQSWFHFSTLFHRKKSKE